MIWAVSWGDFRKHLVNSRKYPLSSVKEASIDRIDCIMQFYWIFEVFATFHKRIVFIADISYRYI